MIDNYGIMSKGQANGLDLAIEPFVPQGWSVESHDTKISEFEWDPTKVSLHLSDDQKDGKPIKGHKLREELAPMLVFNANLFGYLLKNRHLIPDEWKKDEAGNTRRIYFWGTVFRSPQGALYVYFLDWDINEWSCGKRWLDTDWNSSSPAVCLSR